MLRLDLGCIRLVPGIPAGLDLVVTRCASFEVVV